jgi:phosphoribosylglycinamide formyltransferase-1
MRPVRLAVFISGRGSNLQALLTAQQQGVLRGLAEIVGVFSDNPRAGGLAIARGHGIPTVVHEPGQATRQEFDRLVLLQTASFRADWLILAGYRRVISPVLLDAFPGRVVNIHPADPKVFCGLHGYRHAFENRFERTVITVHYVDEGIDTGTIIAQEEVDLRGTAGLAEIEARGLAVEHSLYPRALAGILSSIRKENT